MKRFCKNKHFWRTDKRFGEKRRKKLHTPPFPPPAGPDEAGKRTAETGPAEAPKGREEGRAYKVTLCPSGGRRIACLRTEGKAADFLRAENPHPPIGQRDIFILTNQREETEASGRPDTPPGRGKQERTDRAPQSPPAGIIVPARSDSSPSRREMGRRHAPQGAFLHIRRINSRPEPHIPHIHAGIGRRPLPVAQLWRKRVSAAGTHPPLFVSPKAGLPSFCPPAQRPCRKKRAKKAPRPGRFSEKLAIFTRSKRRLRPKERCISLIINP